MLRPKDQLISVTFATSYGGKIGHKQDEVQMQMYPLVI